MESIVAASATRLQTSTIERTLEQRQTLRSQLEAEQTRVQNIRNEQRLADRAGELINEARFDRELIRADTDSRRISDEQQRIVDDNRRQIRDDRQIDDNLAAVDDQLTREAIRDAFNPLPELQREAATQRAFDNDNTLPIRNEEVSLRELLAERNARLTDRAADDRAFAEQQSQDFQRSVRAVDAFISQPGDALSLEERGAIVDFQA